MEDQLSELESYSCKEESKRIKSETIARLRRNYLLLEKELSVAFYVFHFFSERRRKISPEAQIVDKVRKFNLIQ